MTTREAPTANPDAIRSTYRWLAHAMHGVSELRVIRPSGPLIGLGFFDDEEAFVRSCLEGNEHGNVYVGIQPRPRGLLDRSANRLHGSRRGAKIDDIEVVTATVIDLDPVRPKNSASTQDELAAALEVARLAADGCVDGGLARSRIVMSGNGAQLWFAVPPIALDDENRATVRAGLRAFEASIRERFATSRVVVDAIHDVARIIKVAGTVSRKGVPSTTRPHRTSAIIEGEARVEDAKLAGVLLAGAPPIERTTPTAAQRSLPIAASASNASSNTETCSPVRRLFAEGQDDRSLALFNAIRWLAHTGLALDEITTRIVAWDAEHGSKLAGRDAAAYVAKAYAKIVATADVDGTVAPPCKSLQRAGFCAVNNDPAARCELKSSSLDAWLRESKSETRASTATSPVLAPPVKGAVFIVGGRYCVANSEGRVQAISSFTLVPKMRIAGDHGETIVADAHVAGGTVVRDVRIPLSAFTSRRDFLRHLPALELQWTGSDDNVQGVLGLIARRPMGRRRGATVLGAHEVGGRTIWLLPDRALDASGPLPDPPLVHVATGSTIDRHVRFEACDEPALRAVASIVFQHLWRVNAPEVALPVLGWFFATPLKPALMRLVGSFPTLFVWGTQGSGKTCLVTEIFWPLFGVVDAEPFSATETEFALVKLLSSTTSIPIFIDEYKPFDMPKHRLATLHRVVRRLYRGETEERGTPDLRVNAYALTAPLCIAGETRPSEAAILERLLTANPSKHALDDRPEHAAAFRALRAAPLHLFAERYVCFCLGRDVADDLRVARAITRSLLVDRKVPIRVADNLTIMVLGVHLFAEYAKSLGVALPLDLGMKRAVGAVLADVLEEKHGVKNALDAFVEMLSVMAIQGELIDRRHYRIDKDQLYLHLESAYDAYRAHCQRIGYEGEIVDLRGLRRLAHENHAQHGYVSATQDRVCFDGRGLRRRVLALDLRRTSLVSADDFVQEAGT